MVRMVKITFERGGEVSAILQESQAPETCKVIWDALPIESDVTQSRWSGREVNFSYEDKNHPRRENQTIYTSIGELCYWRDWNNEFPERHSHVIAIYYGAEMARSNRGHEPVNVFAQVIPGDLEKLACIGKRIWLKGSEKVYFQQEST
jgi:hypothetical protein